MTNEERKAALEAIIYAADDPATIEQLAEALGEEKLAVQSSLDELVASYAADDRGVEVRAVAGGYKMYTKPQHHDLVRRFIKSLRPPLRLTMPALETLAVIAYKQPVTAPEIQEIRGVNTSGVIKTLLDKRLITTAGRKEVIGRPILYRTSKDFLMRFGLSDLQELPSLKEFEALAREALGSDEGLAPSESGDESVLDSLPRPEATTAETRSEANAEASHAIAEQSIPGNHDGDATVASALDSENVPYIAVPSANRANSEQTSLNSHIESSPEPQEQTDADDGASQAHKAVAGE
ncbi:MAG TPA: SMC-Scp complex subunit ScpB [Candidatus Eisenbacteria bacterium]|jgi:segregation and condensation protein B|nr:SMC-Scp complex subunit ScpB [Candidatus Eisenbacteria bacterium]